MKLLKCKLCSGEVDIVGADRSVNKKVKCTKCGFNNLEDYKNKNTEIVVIKKRI